MLVFFKRVNVLLVLLFCLVFVLASCGSGETTAPTTTTAPSTTTAPDTTEAEIPLDCTTDLVRCGSYMEDDGLSEINIFTDVQAFDAFEAKYILPRNLDRQLKTEYTITFFKTYSVAVIYMKTESITDIPYLDSVTQNQSTKAFTVKIGANRHGESVDAKVNWLVFVSFPKEAEVDKTNVTVKYLSQTPVPEVPYTADVFCVMGAVDDEIYEDLTVIHSYRDFVNYQNDRLAKSYLYGDIRRYDEAFFEDHFLIVVLFKCGDTAQRPYIKSLTNSDGLTVSLGTHVAIPGAAVPREWMLLLSVSCEDVTDQDRKAELNILPYEMIDEDTYLELYPQIWEVGRPQYEAEVQYNISQNLLKPDAEDIAVIQTYEQLVSFKEQYLHKAADLSRYDEAYFEEHTLVTVYQFGYTGMLRFYVQNVYYYDGRLTVHVGTHLPGEPGCNVTDDSVHGLAFITLPRMETLTVDDVIKQVLPEEHIGDRYYELYPNDIYS